MKRWDEPLRGFAVALYAMVRLRPLARLARACRKGLRIDWI